MLEKRFAIQISDIVYGVKNSSFGPFLSTFLHVYNRLISLYRRLRIETSVISGKIGGEEIKIFFAGKRQNRSYLARIAFGGEYSEIYVKKAFLWRLPFIASKFSKECALGIVEVNIKYQRFFKKGFFVPCWTGGDVDLSDQKRLALSSKKSDIRKIRKNGLSREITRDPARFEEFHRKMYLPFIKKAHGEMAFHTSMEEIRKVMGESELLLVKKGDEYIGGAIIQYLDRPHLWIMGLAGGNGDNLKLGVTAAIDHFTEERLKEKGYQRMHYGGSRPFLKDGVLQYKKWRGQVLRDFTKRGFLIFLSGTRGAESFLLENPFIYLEEERLAGAVFMRTEDFGPDTAARICHDYFMKGISRLNIFMIGGGKLPELPPELQKEVSLSHFPLS